MTHEQSELHAKTVALALYQIRVLLSSYLGSQNEGGISVRQAAHLAYALHNEALALVQGGSFDFEAVIRRLHAVDGMLGSEFSRLFAEVLNPSARSRCGERRPTSACSGRAPRFAQRSQLKPWYVGRT